MKKPSYCRVSDEFSYTVAFTHASRNGKIVLLTVIDIGRLRVRSSGENTAEIVDAGRDQLATIRRVCKVGGPGGVCDSQ